jgi:hypothetical protein
MATSVGVRCEAVAGQKDVYMEAEEATALEAVTRRQLVKTYCVL